MTSNQTVINQEMFTHIGSDDTLAEAIQTESLTYFQDAWRRFFQNKVAVVCLIILGILVLMSFVGPLIVPFQYSESDLLSSNQSPSSEHWFGTDNLGRDMWARVWVGGRISFFVGIVAALSQGLIGITVGCISGYVGGKLDMLIMRFIDIMIAIPYMIIVILIMVVLGSGVMPIITAFAITGWLNMARLVRGQIMQLKNEDYILATKSLGVSHWTIMFKHLVPNTMGVIIVSLTMAIPNAIFSEAFLSFIGIGINPPMTSWGQLVNLGIKVMRTHPYQLIIPAFFISITMLCLQLVGDGMRDALDPKLRR